jgi:two-component sensor histidine kinase
MLARLEAYTKPAPVPEPDTEAEADIFAACGLLFLHPAAADRARRALRTSLGGTTLELLTAYLAFIRTAHYWTETHPDLVFEDDMEDLMRRHEKLTTLLLNPADGARNKLGQRLYDELLLLRGERDDRIALRKALADREESQRHQTLLIHELNHRVKNTLSIIQSIAKQTLKGDTTPPEVREAFMARLMALAEAHDILTAESWDGAELKAVVSKTLSSHVGSERVSIAGPVVWLAPKRAVTLSMAFHELATNAASYGALSNDDGRVSIDWSVSENDVGPRLLLTWKETGGPIVKAPTRRGFGTRLVERGLAGELEGEAIITFEPEGMVCMISAPLATMGG